MVMSIKTEQTAPRDEVMEGAATACSSWSWRERKGERDSIRTSPEGERMKGERDRAKEAKP